jgi:hypothetical protein
MPVISVRDGVHMWISSVRELNTLTSETFMWDPAWLVLAVRREDEDLLHDNDVQVKLHVAETLSHAFDIMSQLLYHEVPSHSY